MNKELEFPAYLSDEAKDLIDKIIMIDPMMRLGLPESKNDITVMKEHPFFKDIDFEKISTYNVRLLLEEEDKVI